MHFDDTLTDGKSNTHSATIRLGVSEAQEKLLQRHFSYAGAAISYFDFNHVVIGLARSNSDLVLISPQHAKCIDGIAQKVDDTC